MIKHTLIILSFLYLVPVSANQALKPVTAEAWKTMVDQVHLIEGSTALLPSLLPFIMENKELLQLTQEQTHSFREWRKNNYTNMVNIMNEIIALKIQFRSESMLPEVSDDYLMDIQSKIHKRQQALLKLRLSCRHIVMSSFTDQQWEDFAFVASENTAYASLLIQNTSNYPYLSYDDWLAEKYSKITPAAGTRKVSD